MKVIFDGEPQMSPYGDDGEWVLNAPFLVKVDREDGSGSFWITVPRGFITDLASVPKFLPLTRSFLGGKARRAAVAHDYLYVHPHPDGVRTPKAKAFADDVFMAAMKAEGVNGFVRGLFFTAVHWFGGGIGWRQLGWPVDDNYLGRFCAGARPVREAGSIVNRSPFNEGSRCARQEDHGPPSAKVQATPPEAQSGRRSRQGRHQ